MKIRQQGWNVVQRSNAVGDAVNFSRQHPSDAVPSETPCSGGRDFGLIQSNLIGLRKAGLPK